MKLLKNGKFSVRARLLGATLSLGVLSASSFSCVSGGWTATRAVAKWNNSNFIVLRILMYPLLLPVFIVTELIDGLILNTIDFWSGKVSAKNETYDRDGTRIEVAHTRLPLRKSVFTVTAKNGTKTVTELRETAQGSIEVYVNDVKRSEARNIEDATATLVTYQNDGRTPASVETIQTRGVGDLGQSSLLACQR